MTYLLDTGTDNLLGGSDDGIVLASQLCTEKSRGQLGGKNGVEGREELTCPLVLDGSAIMLICVWFRSDSELR